MTEPEYTQEDLDAARQEGYDDGHSDGYDEGFEEGRREGESEGFSDAVDRMRSLLSSL